MRPIPITIGYRPHRRYQLGTLLGSPSLKLVILSLHDCPPRLLLSIEGIFMGTFAERFPLVQQRLQSGVAAQAHLNGGDIAGFTHEQILVDRAGSKFGEGEATVYALVAQGF